MTSPPFVRTSKDFEEVPDWHYILGTTSLNLGFQKPTWYFGYLFTNDDGTTQWQGMTPDGVKPVFGVYRYTRLPTPEELLEKEKKHSRAINNPWLLPPDDTTPQIERLAKSMVGSSAEAGLEAAKACGFEFRVYGNSNQIMSINDCGINLNRISVKVVDDRITEAWVG